MMRTKASGLALALLAGSGAAFAQGRYADLVKLDTELLAFRKPIVIEGVIDRTAAAMEAQRNGLEEFKKRLRAMDTSSWSVPEKADYLLVWAKLNALAFDHRVMKPWAR